MLVYIAFRFEWIYGVAAVIAVFHDTIITVGLFSLFGKEISLTVVAALLTLVGYSMNDTIVVFDRIRENLKLMRREKFEPLVNSSINQTLSRTILTSGLTFLTAISLFLFARAGAERVRFRAGSWYYRRHVFFDLHRESDPDLLAELLGKPEGQRRGGVGHVAGGGQEGKSRNTAVEPSPRSFRALLKAGTKGKGHV